MGRLSVAVRERGETIEVDISHGEAAEAQLDAFIARRARERIRENGRTASQDAATARAELWKGSVARYQERVEEQKRAERREFHEAHAARLRSTMGALVSYHEAEAEKYREKENGHEKGD